MQCKRFQMGDVTVVVCGPRRPQPKCPTPGCTNRVEWQCEYPVTRNGKARDCDAFLCSSCRTNIDGKDYCRPHRGLVQPKATQRSFDWSKP